METETFVSELSQNMNSICRNIQIDRYRDSSVPVCLGVHKSIFAPDTEFQKSPDSPFDFMILLQAPFPGLFSVTRVKYHKQRPLGEGKGLFHHKGKPRVDPNSWQGLKLRSWRNNVYCVFSLWLSQLSF